jgi:hypothetical protein
MLLRLLSVWGLAMAVRAQTVCPPTPTWSPCEIAFDVPGAAAPDFDLHAEFRSPSADTALVRAFHEGGGRWTIRFTPVETGTYQFRLTSSLPALDGKSGQFTATASDKKGWLRAANVHHWALVQGTTLTPHLWMGFIVPNFESTSEADWKTLIDRRAAQHFNHVGVTLVDEGSSARFQTPEFFRQAEEKIRYANQHGLIVDIAFFGPNGLMNRLLKSREDRQKWFTAALSRLAAFDVTWQGLEGWESYDNGRDLLKEIAEYLSNLDPYKHPRSSRADIATGALADDGWLRYRSYRTGDDQIGTVDQQFYKFPAVNDFGEGANDADTFRHLLWNSTADGQYPDTVIPSEQDAAYMKSWYEFMTDNRHWELEPFFDVTNGRGVALQGVEYIIYVEKPGPVTLNPERQSYDVEWFNPVNGETVRVKEKSKGETFTTQPPDNSHDWVLHLEREGHKNSMLKSYYFDSQEIVMQEIEGDPAKVPFEIVQPAGDSISFGLPSLFEIKLKRHSKALDNMSYEWTGEVTASERGARVIATGASGTLRIPANIAADYPASLHIRLTAVNGLGKAYVLDRNYNLTR